MPTTRLTPVVLSTCILLLAALALMLTLAARDEVLPSRMRLERAWDVQAAVPTADPRAECEFRFYARCLHQARYPERCGERARARCGRAPQFLD